MALILLASYPKSGNTWFRALLSNYFSNGDTPAALTDLGAQAVLSLTSTLEEVLGLDPDALNPAEQVRYRGDICRLMAREMPDGAFVKVHDGYSADPELFPPDAVRGVIYLARDPREVAPSYAWHLGCSVDEAVARMTDPDETMFRADDKPMGQFRQHLGTWAQHVEGWLDQTALPVHLVTYEDLAADPAHAFTEALAFAGHTPDPKRVAFAISASELSTLQRLERQTGFPEKSPTAPSFFGRRSAGKDRGLSAAQSHRLTAVNNTAMRRLGYPPDTAPKD